MSPENRLQTKEYLDDAYAAYLDLIARGRHLDRATLIDIANNLKSENADDALNVGLVDQIAYQDEACNWMRRRLGIEADKKMPFVTLGDYHLGHARKPSTAKDRIAEVYAEGEIHPGDTEYGIIGDKRYTEILSKLRTDDKVKAVVLRVNSPGGSILASENILRELSLLQEAGKPLVVSMGDYAASGGYYIAALGDSIFAEPTTLTGSIGVFSMIPNFRELMNDKLGIQFDTVRTGDYSASFTPFLDWSETEHASMQARTDGFYDLFLGHVSEFRDMTKEEVHAIAQGRIWSGTDAVANGLVDKIGSLQDAVDAAASLAGLTEYRTSDYPRVPNPINRLLEELTGEELTASADAYIETRISRHVPHFRELKSMLDRTGPTMRLPVILEF
jgi:protease-4